MFSYTTFICLCVCVCVQGECRYEQELLPYLHEADTVDHDALKNRQKKSLKKSSKTCSKTTINRPKPSHSAVSDLECLDEEAETTGPFFTVTKQRPSHEAPHEDFTDHPGPEAVCPPSPKTDMDDDCAIISESAATEPVNLGRSSQPVTNFDEDEDVELQAMFYLPRWDPAPPLFSAKLPSGKDEKLRVILANVAELLSRSPPPSPIALDADAPPPPPSPPWLQQPFPISFTLDVDDEEEEEEDVDDGVMMNEGDNTSQRADSNRPPACKDENEICNDQRHQEQQPVHAAADSPTWDEVFGDDEEQDGHCIGGFGKETDEEMCTKLQDGQTRREAEINVDDLWNEDMADMMEGGGGGKDDRASHCSSQTDKSMDLFGDDEAFLQMSIPNISTPNITRRTSLCAGNGSNSMKKMTNSSQIDEPANIPGTIHTTESTDELTTAKTNELACKARQTSQDANISNTTKDTHRTPGKPVIDSPMTDEVFITHCKSPTVQQNADGSHEYFSVNFDLCYSPEASEDEIEEEASAPPPKKQADFPVSLPAASSSSTPCSSSTRQRASAQLTESRLSTAQRFSEHGMPGIGSSFLSSPVMPKGGALPSPITSMGARRTLISGPSGPQTPSSLSRLKRRQPESVCVSDSPPHPGLFNMVSMKYISFSVCFIFIQLETNISSLTFLRAVQQ